MLEELQNIRKLLERKKVEHDLVLEDTETSIKVNFPKPMRLDGNGKIGLKLLSTYYSVPNIDQSNNVFRYATNGEAYRELKLETGSYEIDNIAEKIKDFQQNFYQYAADNAIVKTSVELIELKPDPSTMKCIISVPQNMSVDFTPLDSIGLVLGFSRRILSSGVHVSDLPVDINPLNTIMVHCDIASGSIHNGQPSRSIYQFAPKVPPGYKIVEEARQITYHSIPHDEISGIHVWLTDQNGNNLNNRNERLTIVLHMIL